MPRFAGTPVQTATPFEAWWNGGAVMGDMPDSTPQQIKWFIKKAWDAGVEHGEKKSARKNMPDSDTFTL